MKKRDRGRSNIATGLGLALVLFGCWLEAYLHAYENGLDWLARLSFILGGLMMFVGFWLCVQAKGYNPAWALLFFIFGPLAVLVFFWLPDRSRQKAEGT